MWQQEQQRRRAIVAERSENARLLGALEDGLQMARARNVATAESRHGSSSPAPRDNPTAAGAHSTTTTFSDSQQRTSDKRSAANVLTVGARGSTSWPSCQHGRVSAVSRQLTADGAADAATKAVAHE
jgi:hypothetical protein